MLLTTAISALLAALASREQRGHVDESQLRALENTLLGGGEPPPGDSPRDRSIRPVKTYSRLSWDERHDLPDRNSRLYGLSVYADDDMCLEDLADYYPQTAEGSLCDDPDLYHESNVAWGGTEGKMMRVHWSEVEPIEGNIFSSDKLAAVMAAVRDSPEKLCFTAGYGAPGIVDINEVIESQHYDSGDERLSTGDEDLDEFLRSPEGWLDDNWFIGEAHFVPGISFLLSEEQHDMLDEMESDIESFTEDGESLELHMERYLRDKGAYLKENAPSVIVDPELKLVLTTDGAEALKEKREELEEAVTGESGDLGKLRFQVRNGNHRTFGALLGGEDYVWLIVANYVMTDIYDAQAKHRRGEKLSGYEQGKLRLGELLQ